MYNPTEQFAEFNKTNVAQATKFAALSLENAEKFVKFNLGAAKTVFAQSVEGAQAARLGQGRAGPARAAHQVRRSASAKRDRATRVNLYELATEAQADYSALAEEAFGVYTKGVARGSTRPASRRRPARTSAVNAFKSTIAATTAAFDQFQKASKQVASLADANVRAAAATATKAVKERQAA